MRIAEYLSTTGQAETFLIDYEDGYMSINRDKALTKLLPYSDDGGVCVPSDSILILQSMTPWSIFPGLNVHKDTKLIFWTCYPFGLVPLLPGMRTWMQASPNVSSVILNSFLYGFKKKMRNFSHILINNDALIFQDTACVKITKNYLNMSIEHPKFLNIPAMPCLKTKVNPKERIQDEKLLKFTWVGRIVDMKYFILKYAIAKLNAIQKSLEYKIEINIVGHGDYLPRLKKDCLGFNDVSINFIGHLAPSDLDEFLLSDTDVLLAMGTSALEGAKLGIPTILLDVSYREVPEGFVFTWLHERSDNAIGEILSIDKLDVGNDSLKNKTLQIINNYAEISEKELGNFSKNHALDSISQSLLNFCLRSKVSWRMLDELGFLERGCLYKLFHLVRGQFKTNRGNI
jgi:hypothetical protein